jgi:hypothetical protein
MPEVARVHACWLSNTHVTCGSRAALHTLEAGPLYATPTARCLAQKGASARKQETTRWVLMGVPTYLLSHEW